MALGKEEIENRFGFHKATTEGENATLPRHRDVRIKFREVAEWLDVLIPDGRAKSVMMMELETASMWAHKAIAEEAPLHGEYSPNDLQPHLEFPDPEEVAANEKAQEFPDPEEVKVYHETPVETAPVNVVEIAD